MVAVPSRGILQSRRESRATHFSAFVMERISARKQCKTFTETKDNTVYFDRRPGLVASPVQTYLELVTGDKRSQETAEQLRRPILRPLERRAG